MAKQSTLRAIYGEDYDLVDPRKHKRFSTLADDLSASLPRLGLRGALHHLVQTMLLHRYSLARAIPGVSALARELGLSRQHVSGLIAVLEQAQLLIVQRPRGKPCRFDLSPLIARARALLRRKQDAPAARLPSRLPPKAPPAAPAEAPAPAREEAAPTDAPAALPGNRYAAFLWQQVQQRLQLVLSAAAYQNWIDPLRGMQWEDGLLWVDTGDSTRLLQAENRFLDLANRYLAEMLPGGQVRFYYPKARHAATSAARAQGG